jgi:4'-phosphopantetheinyl transferase
MERVCLEAGRVDVWLTPSSVPAGDLKRAYQHVLSPSECDRWQRIVIESAQDQYLMGRALIRTTLSQYADVPPSRWEFETNEYGRPYIAYPQECRELLFNLSHTEGLVACVVGKGCEIGIDVENVMRDMDLVSLARVTFAPAEMARFMAARPADRRRWFFSYWTLKEAYIKARGMGLAIPLDAFWFELGGPSLRIHFTDRCRDTPERWQFSEFAPTNVHWVALAVAMLEGKRVQIQLRWTTPLIDT